MAGVHALSYIRRSEAKGQDVSRLAETFEKRTASLIRHRACFACGTVQTNPDSIREWERDRLGSECRSKLGRSWHETTFGLGQRQAVA